MENTTENGDSVIVECRLKALVDKVWQALTNVEQMRKWYFNVNNFKPVVGFEFEFTAGSENTQYLHKCVIKEVIPGKKIAYSWRYEGYQGNSLVTFELFEEGEYTQVKITHSGLETFPDEEAFAKSSFNSGWTHILNHQLKNFVEKN